MCIKNIAIFFFILLFGRSLFSDSSNFGSWFSKKIEFRNGFEFLQLNIQKNKFILAKLSYNDEKKWEETRILGFVEETKEGNFRLKSEMCMVYATKKLGQRWILIQGFDCDHLEMQMAKKEKEIFISPSIGITETAVLKRGNNISDSTITAIIIFEENTKFQAWSLAMRNIRKGSKAFLNNKPITIIETVDSTGIFESKDSIQLGDIILINNRNASDLFD